MMTSNSRTNPRCTVILRIPEGAEQAPLLAAAWDDEVRATAGEIVFVSSKPDGEVDAPSPLSDDASTTGALTANPNLTLLRAAREARGDVIVVVGPDVRPIPGCLESNLRFHASKSSLRTTLIGALRPKGCTGSWFSAYGNPDLDRCDGPVAWQHFTAINWSFKRELASMASLLAPLAEMELRRQKRDSDFRGKREPFAGSARCGALASRYSDVELGLALERFGVTSHLTGEGAARRVPWTFETLFDSLRSRTDLLVSLAHKTSLGDPTLMRWVARGESVAPARNTFIEVLRDLWNEIEATHAASHRLGRDPGLTHQLAATLFEHTRDVAIASHLAITGPDADRDSVRIVDLMPLTRPLSLVHAARVLYGDGERAARDSERWIEQLARTTSLGADLIGLLLKRVVEGTEAILRTRPAVQRSDSMTRAPIESKTRSTPA